MKKEAGTLTVHIVTEPGYGQSIWCDKICAGLVGYAKQRRIKTEIADGDFVSEKSDAIAIIGSTPEWIKATVAHVSETQEAPAVLISTRPYRLAVTNICTDLYSATEDVLSYLSMCGKTRTALFGVNPSSISDEIKSEAFGSRGGCDADIYRNLGDLKACSAYFVERSDKYDSVICTNDFAAVSLLDLLRETHPEKARGLFIVSFGFANSGIAEHYSVPITSVEQNYEEYGRVMIDLLPLLTKNKSISYITVNVRSRIVVRETTQGIPFGHAPADGVRLLTPEKVDFYSDSEVKPFMAAEKLLGGSDDTDISIIKSLLAGNSYEKTAEKNFLTVNGVKYRLKRMCALCEAPDVKTLLGLLRKAHIF